MPATVEPEVSTSSLPNSPSMFDDPSWEKEISAALVKDGKMESPPEPPAAEPKADVPPVAEAKPDAKVDAKPEAKAEDADEIPSDIKSPAAQSSWKKLKESKKAVETERDTIRKERESLKAELETLRKQAQTPQQKANLADDPEYQGLKKAVEAKDKELSELSERLRIVDVTQHPKFEAYFKGKTEQQYAAAKTIGGDKVVELLKMPASEYRDQQIEELMLELTPFKQAQLGAVVLRLNEIETERSAEISKARENYQQIQAQQKLEAEKQRTQYEGTFKTVLSEVTDKEKGLAVFQERDGDDAWNRSVAERLTLARAAVDGKLSYEQGVRLAHWGAAAPEFLKQLSSERTASAEKIAALEKQIADLRAVQPAPGGEKPGESDSPPASKLTGLDAMMADIEKIVPGARY